MDWRALFGVDSINGYPGHELKAFGRKLVGTYLRVGLLTSQAWRTFKLHGRDFAPWPTRCRTGDDITASVVAPAGDARRAGGGRLARRRRLQVHGQLRGAAVPAARTTRSTAASTAKT